MSVEKRGQQILDEVSKGSGGRTKLRIGNSPGTVPAMLAGESGAQLRQDLDAANERIKGLETDNAVLKKGDRLIALDPAEVTRSRFANRHPLSFRDAAFAELRDLIRTDGGNKQPIKVRPITGNPDFKYEVVYGHRRHAVCLELGIQVTAIIAQLSDVELLQEMQSENSGRRNPTPYERGVHLAGLLKDGVFQSTREMGPVFGISQGQVVKLMQYAELPAEIIGAFPDPRELRPTWVRPLLQAWRDNASVVKDRLSELEEDKLSTMAIYTRLTESETPDSRRLFVRGDQVYARARKVGGRPAIVFAKDAPDAMVDEIRAVLDRWTKQAKDRDS